VHPTIKFFSA